MHKLPDAQGGMARFINHSCDPNCHTKTVTIDGDKHIIIYSKRRIERGEELTYNYKVLRDSHLQFAWIHEFISSLMLAALQASPVTVQAKLDMSRCAT